MITVIGTNYEEIKVALARRLGHEPKEEIWNRLVEEDYVRDVWLQIAEIDDLEKDYRQFSRMPKVPAPAYEKGCRFRFPAD